MKKISNVPRDSAEEMLSRIPMKSLGTDQSTCKKCSTLSKVGTFAKKKLGRQEKVAAEAKESMADLPKDLAEDVLYRIPMKYLRRVQSTCKAWHTLSKDKSFAKQYIDCQLKVPGGKDKFMLILMMDYKIHLLSVNFNKNVESFMKREGTLIGVDDSDQIDQIFHCEGLLLCISEDNTKLVVWNPYLGQTRRIKPTHTFERLDLYTYALGYDKNSNSHKILSFVDYKILEYNDTDAHPTDVTFAECKIYDFNSDSWRVLDVTPDLSIDYNRRFSLKGNTYWLSKSKAVGGDEDACLLCFDFTTERFGPRLPLPPFEYHSNHHDIALSSVREEQLAVLVQGWNLMQIWVTTKIEPNEVSWSSHVFLAVEMRELNYLRLNFPATHESFFIDKERQVAVVFDKEKEGLMNVAYIVGVDGSLKTVYLGGSAYKCCLPSVCSYVPSAVQLY